MERQLLEKLYNSFYREIYLYLFSLCKRKELAEDLAQETFLKALLALPKEHPNFRAWLYTVARNLFLNACHKENRVLYMDDLSEQAQEDGILDGILQSERNRTLHRALMRLDTRKREILVLHYFGGMPHREIAAILKLTPENVKVLTCRAKRELKKILEELGYDIS